MTEHEPETAEIVDEFEANGFVPPPSREVAVRAAAPAERDVVDGWVEKARSIFYLADRLAGTEFVPGPLRNKPAAVAATILMGRELGIGPLFSFRAVQVIEGSPGLSAEFKRARVLAAGHQIEVLELTDTRCVVRGRRKGSSEWTQLPPYTIDDARKAGLVRARGPWETRPRRMLLARATSDLCDAIFPDVVLGLPTTELMEGGYEGYAEQEAGQPALPAPAPAQVMQRRTRVPRKTASPPEPGLPEEPAAGPEPASESQSPGEPGAPASHQPEVDNPEPPANPDRKATKSERDAIFSRLSGDFGVTDKALRLRAATAILGRPVASFNDLTSGDAYALLDSLAACKAQATAEVSAFARLGQLVRLAEQTARHEAKASGEPEPPRQPPMKQDVLPDDLPPEPADDEPPL